MTKKRFLIVIDKRMGYFGQLNYDQPGGQGNFYEHNELTPGQCYCILDDEHPIGHNWFTFNSLGEVCYVLMMTDPSFEPVTVDP